MTSQNNKTTPHVLVVDTCVWLDLAKDPANEPLVRALEDLVNVGDFRIYCPDIVLEEFSKNRDRVIRSSQQRFSQEFRRIKKIIQEFGSDDNKQLVTAELDNVHHKLPILTEASSQSVDAIERLIKNAVHCETTTDHKLRAAERALLGQAPFHKNKNSIADALIMEHFIELVRGDEHSGLTFVTLNIHDFSSPVDNREPHEHYSKIFDDDRVSYKLSLFEALNDIVSDAVEDYMFDYNWTEDTRGLTEIVDHIDEFIDKVWYDRHYMRAQSLEEGKTVLVDDGDPRSIEAGCIGKKIWAGAIKHAKEIENTHPGEIGPYDSFEWGMLNGKLSALRWVLGDEWDMLDT